MITKRITPARAIDRFGGKLDFKIDTALSWDGSFPPIGDDDFIVSVGTCSDDVIHVLVSRRYVGACDAADAASIATDAARERGNTHGDAFEVFEVKTPTMVLGDDGTLDTVIVCNDCGAEYRYNFASAEGDEGSDAYDTFVDESIDDATDTHGDDGCGEEG